MDIQKEKNINCEKIKIISRKIDKDKFQVPINKTNLPDTVYSTSF